MEPLIVTSKWCYGYDDDDGDEDDDDNDDHEGEDMWQVLNSDNFFNNENHLPPINKTKMNYLQSTQNNRDYVSER